MAICVIRTCDKCKASDGGHAPELELYRLKLTLTCTKSTYAPPSLESRVEMPVWCRACLVGSGIWEAKAEVPAAANPPALEDVIREIAGEAAIEAVQNR